MPQQSFFYNSHPVGEHDVICGKKCEKHPGNAAFRKMVLEYRQRYQSTSTREMKKQIIEEVIARVTKIGGRFIKDDGSTMVDVTSQYVYEKVSHALRSAQPSKAAKALRQSHKERKSGFEDLLATQQKLFYSYLAASSDNEDDDDSVSTASALEDTVPNVKIASQTGTEPRQPSIYNVVDDLTLSVLMNLQEAV